mgnify:CR=1 FL=1
MDRGRDRGCKSSATVIEFDNPAAADRVAQAILSAAEALAHHPALGRPLPTLPARVLVEARYRYKLIYEIDVEADIIRILRVFHPRQNRP